MAQSLDVFDAHVWGVLLQSSLMKVAYAFAAFICVYVFVRLMEFEFDVSFRDDVWQEVRGNPIAVAIFIVGLLIAGVLLVGAIWS